MNALAAQEETCDVLQFTEIVDVHRITSLSNRFQ
jgi:hypothetical protein